MQVLANYKSVSGKLINKYKSHFILHSSGFPSTINRIKQEISFKHKMSLITYLGFLFTQEGKESFTIQVCFLKWWQESVVGRLKFSVMEVEKHSSTMCFSLYLFTFYLH